jgi:hypothetical protein
MSDNPRDIFSSPDKFHAKLEQLRAETNPSQENVVNEVNEVNNVDNTPKENINIRPEEESNENGARNDNEIDAQEEESDNAGVDEVANVSTGDYKENKFIPKSRFNQEIGKRKALEEQLKSEHTERVKYEAQLRMLQEQITAANNMYQQPQNNQQMRQTEPEIEPLDPDTHNLYMRKINELEQKLDNTSRATNEQTKQLQYYNMITNQEQHFEKDHPDFRDALKHLQKIEVQIAANLMPEQNVNSYVSQKLQNILINSVESGKNAAEVVYNMAKTYGYSPNYQQDNAGPKVNLDAINKNMKNNASINSLGNSVNMSENKNDDINSMRRDPKNPMSSIDPDKFHAALARLRS